MVASRADSKPGSNACIRTTLRTIRPAPAASDRARAICTTTNSACPERPRCPRAVAAAPPRDASGSRRDIPTAGTSPNRTVVAIAASSVNPIARRSRSTKMKLGTPITFKPLTASSVQAARARPTPAAHRPRTTLSDSSWRTIWPGPAPSDTRTANSRARIEPCASRRVAMFAHATRSRRPAAPSTTSSGTRRSPTRACRADTTRTPLPAFDSGWARANRPATMSSADRASGIDCPSVSRPTTDSQRVLRPPRMLYWRRLGFTVSNIPKGTQRSASAV